jgi:hypothetical protein
MSERLSKALALFIVPRVTIFGTFLFFSRIGKLKEGIRDVI